LDRDRKAVSVPRKKLEQVLKVQFGKWEKAVIARLSQVRKDDKDTIDRILEAIDAGDLALLVDDAQELLEEITANGGAAALAQIGFTADESITDQLNEYALDYAKDRSAEMVGKRWVEGELVDNPNAQWVITESTRDMLRADIAAAIESGASNERLAGEISENYAFSDQRAETVARTESAKADVAGNLNAYRESGQVEAKRWLAAPDCCDECQDLDGETVDIDEDFPGDAGDGPPLHPNCRCDVLPVLSDEQS
jgi:SPP1 gp7 family putative phage head morphogenesis protein